VVAVVCTIRYYLLVINNKRGDGWPELWPVTGLHIQSSHLFQNYHQLKDNITVRSNA